LPAIILNQVPRVAVLFVMTSGTVSTTTNVITRIPTAGLKAMKPRKIAGIAKKMGGKFGILIPSS